MRILFLSAALGAMLAAAAARADEDHDRAFEALRRGEIAPLEEILQVVRERYGGTVLEVELEHKRGRWVYEVKTLSEDGTIAEVYLDAADKTLLRRKEE